MNNEHAQCSIAHTSLHKKLTLWKINRVKSSYSFDTPFLQSFYPAGVCVYWTRRRSKVIQSSWNIFHIIWAQMTYKNRRFRSGFGKGFFREAQCPTPLSVDRWRIVYLQRIHFDLFVWKCWNSNQIKFKKQRSKYVLYNYRLFIRIINF